LVRALALVIRCRILLLRARRGAAPDFRVNIPGLALAVAAVTLRWQF
jgi:hypothetical protein